MTSPYLVLNAVLFGAPHRYVTNTYFADKSCPVTRELFFWVVWVSKLVWYGVGSPHWYKGREEGYNPMGNASVTKTLDGSIILNRPALDQLNLIE